MADILYAQTTAPAVPAGATAGSSGGPAMLMGFMPWILIFGAFYFLLIMPQNKERKKREEMLKNIQRGERVLTRGGIWGHVADIRENIIVLKIAENTKVEVDRSFIDTVEKVS